MAAQVLSVRLVHGEIKGGGRLDLFFFRDIIKLHGLSTHYCGQVSYIYLFFDGIYYILGG